MNNHKKSDMKIDISKLETVEYPKEYIEELYREIDEVKAQIAAGKRPVFDSVDELLAYLEADGDTIS